MATLDRVMQMQQQGLNDSQITAQLQNEGISPMEINDAINQAKVKNAVYPPSQQQGTPEMTPSMGSPQQGQQPQPEVYPPAQNQQQPAGMDQFSAPMPPAQQGMDQYQGGYQQVYDQNQYPNQQQGYQDNYYEQTPTGYSDQDYYGGGGQASTENISEIAEQVATEKLNEYKKKVGDVATFKNQTQDKINDIDDRLKRIEGTIDKLQQAIIGKIGEFGESNATLHKDLENMHDTMGKLMNPLVDTYNELKKSKK